ncbi:MAG: dihydrodipicolinate synthase family protein [Burkholderiales bacterium]|jgi:dihydrodipicolinate synthase/N-acetylneuraminate lyase|nr:dihydrodipicolinate synthase family protein [Burkholderiales bacterium]
MPVIASLQQDIQVWPDLVLPLKDDLSVDTTKFTAHVRNLASKGIQKFVLFGYAGEGASFSTEEKLSVLAVLAQSGFALEDFLLGVNTSVLHEASALISRAHSLGVRQFLVSSPTFYDAVTDTAKIAFYTHLINQVGLPNWQIFIHQLGGSSASDLSSFVVSELLRSHPQHISGVVDQDPRASRCVGFLESFGGKALVTNCHETNLLMLRPPIAVSALANLIPGVVGGILGKGMAEQKTKFAGMKVKSPDERVISLMAVIGNQPLIASIKFLISVHYRQNNWDIVRPPQSGLSDKSREDLAKAFKAFNLLPNE